MLHLHRRMQIEKTANALLLFSFLCMSVSLSTFFFPDELPGRIQWHRTHHRPPPPPPLPPSLVYRCVTGATVARQRKLVCHHSIPRSFIHSFIPVSVAFYN